MEDILKKALGNEKFAALLNIAFEDFMRKIIRQRNDLRLSGEFVKADVIRETLKSCGVLLTDEKSLPKI